VLKHIIVQFFDDAKIYIQADFGAKSSSRQILAKIWFQADFGTNLVSLLTATGE